MVTAANDDNLLFRVRTHARPIRVGEDDAATGSRIGGPPPTAVPASRCPRCDNAMLYVATVESDLLGDVVSDGRALSLLACGGPCTLRGSGFAVVVHDASPRAGAVDWQWAKGGRRLRARPIEVDTDPDDAEPLRGAKVGGRPFFVDEPVEVDVGAAFLLQLPDDVGPSETGGVYLMGGTGTIYVHGLEGPNGPMLEGASVAVELG